MTERSLAAMLVACVVVVLALVLVSSAVNREIAWTASRTPDARALPVPAPYADTAELFARVDAYVRSEMSIARAPGIALAIVHGDREVHRQGFGHRDQAGDPVRPTTPFILGSLTKSVTALAVMQQVDSGRIELDAPVQRYLPWFTVRDRKAGARITVRQLLNHTSGLPKSAGLQLVRGANAATQKEEARLVSGVRLRHPPGADFEYSNVNYWLLGLVLEAATGVSYERYVTTHVFGPLGMTNSFTDERAAQRHGLAQGYRVWFGFPRQEVLPYYWREMSVGYLISDADDMARYLLAQLTGVSASGQPIVSRRGLETLHTPPRGSPYAMGWLVDTVAGTKVLWHTGAVANYHGDVVLVPSSGWGIVLLSNVNNFVLEGQLSDVAKGVASLLMGYEPPTPRAIRFRGVYAMIAVLALLWLGWRVRQIIGLAAPPTSAARRPGWRRVGPLVDPGIGVGLLIGMPLLLGSPLSTLRWFVPDLSDWLILNAVVAMAVGVARLVRDATGEGVVAPPDVSMPPRMRSRVASFSRTHTPHLILIIVGSMSSSACALITGPHQSFVGAPPAELQGSMVSFTSQSGSTIHAWVAKGRPGGGAVLLLHGVGANRSSMQARALFLHREGFTVLAPDFQAHGESIGNRVTFGLRESQDAAAALAFLRTAAPDERVGVIGVSMGGAAAVLGDGPVTADAFVLESMFPTIRQALRNRLSTWLGPLHMLASSITPPVLGILRADIGVAESRLEPITRIADLRAPLLLLSGSDDHYTPIAEAESLYARASEPKSFWAVKGAGHVDLHDFAPAEYEARVGEFLRRILRAGEEHLGARTGAAAGAPL